MTPSSKQVDQYLEQLKAKPQSKMQARIGIPLEQSTGGPLMRLIAIMAIEYGTDSTWFAINEQQRLVLQKELGRDLCGSGDCLFSTILITCIDSRDDLDHLVETEKVVVDLTVLPSVVLQGTKS